jgi:hypothetical protein
MAKKPKPSLVDDDNPEWTVQDAAAANCFVELPLRYKPSCAVGLTVRR